MNDLIKLYFVDAPSYAIIAGLSIAYLMVLYFNYCKYVQQELNLDDVLIMFGIFFIGLVPGLNIVIISVSFVFFVIWLFKICKVPDFNNIKIKSWK